MAPTALSVPRVILTTILNKTKNHKQKILAEEEADFLLSRQLSAGVVVIAGYRKQLRDCLDVCARVGSLQLV